MRHAKPMPVNPAPLPGGGSPVDPGDLPGGEVLRLIAMADTPAARHAGDTRPMRGDA